MNFKEWLLSEELKSANAPNPKLAKTIPQLNTSVSNPNLTTTIPNQIVKKPLTTNQKNQLEKNNIKIKLLGRWYLDHNKTYPLPGTKVSMPDTIDGWIDLGLFLNSKRQAYRTRNNKIYTGKTMKWYDTDINAGVKAGLPNDWYLPVYKIKITATRPVNKHIEKNNRNIKLLGRWYLDHNKTYPQPGTKVPIPDSIDGWIDLGNLLQNKRQGYRTRNNKIYKGSKWYDADIDAGAKAGLPNDWYQMNSNSTVARITTNQKNQLEKNNIKIKLLGRWYLDHNKTYPLPGTKVSMPDTIDDSFDLGLFLNSKRQGYRNRNNKNYKFRRKWYDTDINAGVKAGLPNDWYQTIDYIENNNIKIKLLVRWYLDNDKTYPPPGTKVPMPDAIDGWIDLGKFLNDKRQGYINRNNKNYTGRRWYDTDIEVAKKAGFPNDWYLSNKANISKPAKLVGKILKKYFDDVVSEYKDSFCVSKTGRCYKFDYYFEYNDKIYFVEYHGQQHYYPIYFGSKKGKTKQKIAENTLNAFKKNQENDSKKYNYCESQGFPLLVIPYWTNPVNFEKIVLKFIKHDDVFDDLFANPLLDVPDKNEKEHTRRLNMTKCFASGKLDCNEIFKKQKTTFEQFLIGKNFTYFNA